MTQTITNRDLLRNYKTYKYQLQTGQVNELCVPQEDGSILKITLHKPQTKTQLLLAKIRKKPLKNISRPTIDVFL